LAAQKLVKSLQSGVKWISALDVHPGGDHLIIGSYDKKLCWFDLDLSNKPFRTLRYVVPEMIWAVLMSQIPLSSPPIRILSPNSTLIRLILR
jgi:hypothetical protein